MDILAHDHRDMVLTAFFPDQYKSDAQIEGAREQAMHCEACRTIVQDGYKRFASFLQGVAQLRNH